MEFDIRFEGGKKINATFNGFTVQTDQPVADGGENSAPGPFDLFLSALGTCAGFYVLSFCEARKISTDNIRLSLLSDYHEEKGRLETVRIHIHLPDEFPEKYKKTLIRVVGQCSVKKAIMNPPEFQISTVP
ncbi:MAG: OsmC family protein [Desulfobacterales bacterium]|jgi:ribosomal protein S12 methylthiotransferase accessory factor|nr:OsmC family protein [Desulfobacterales bacterium]